MEKRGIVLFFVACLACCSISKAGTVTNLIPGGGSVSLTNFINNSGNSILVGDKLFGDFDFIGNGPLPASGIMLAAVSNSIGFGIKITGGFSAQNNELFDYIIDYSVQVTNAPFLISDIHMDYNGHVFGTGHSSVSETFYDTNNFQVGQINVFDPPTQFMQSNAFLSTPLQKLFIEKDILVRGGGDGGSADISVVNQVFSQVQVPEPSSMVLAAIGLGGLWVWRRRRH